MTIIVIIIWALAATKCLLTTAAHNHHHRIHYHTYSSPSYLSQSYKYHLSSYCYLVFANNHSSSSPYSISCWVAVCYFSQVSAIFWLFMQIETLTASTVLSGLHYLKCAIIWKHSGHSTVLEVEVHQHFTYSYQDINITPTNAQLFFYH